MGNYRRKLARRVARHHGVGVQRYYIFHVLQARDIARDADERLFTGPAQQRVQVRYLAPFSFISHPRHFACVPFTGAVKKKKNIPVPGAVFAVKPGYPGGGLFKQDPVACHCFLRCVCKIRNHGEINVPVPVGQKAYFYIFKHRGYAGFAGQQ